MDIPRLIKLKQANTKNPFLSYLNLNSLRYKIIDLREILSKVELEILAISEIKLSSDFPDAQFKVNGYQYPPFRKDRDANEGGLMVLVRNDLIVRRLIDFEPLEPECICIELTLSKKKWAIFSVYRSQIVKVKTLFEKLSKSIDLAINKYENIVVMGDININTHDNHCQGINDLKEFCVICLALQI